jgi:hypothetical protein
MENPNTSEAIINLLASKSTTKYQIYDNTLACFNQIKEILISSVEEISSSLNAQNINVPIEYRERGANEVEIKAAADLLIFVMHTNVFEFPKAHAVMQTGYIKQDPMRSYSGTISIYNFLADSFKYNRLNDIGYLIGRIFVNKDSHFIVEGKRQLGFLFNDFALQQVDENSLKKIIHSALQYAIEFDLLIPPFEEVKTVSVHEMNQFNSSVSLKTGKRLGFNYLADSFSVK